MTGQSLYRVPENGFCGRTPQGRTDKGRGNSKNKANARADNLPLIAIKRLGIQRFSESKYIYDNLI